MEESQEQKQAEAAQESSGRLANRWRVGAFVLLFVAAAFAFGYGRRQGAMIGQLVSHDAEMSATIGQMQGQLNSITGKLNEMSAAQTAAEVPANVRTTRSGQPAATRAAARPEADRLRQMQVRIEQQQKQLKETQTEVAQTRSELEGNLSSTRDELNGSIAKTHEELVALEKRGERNYFEFELAKEKRFQRSGPVMLSLRKADAKHQTLDLAMIVNDNELTKKKVNLYEPVWIYDSNDSQPVQVVVNKISRERAYGYVSAPKYSQTDVAASTTPGSATPSSPDSNASNNGSTPSR
jgi:DNA repair exonuclease SbcCD ATPase subunit